MEKAITSTAWDDVVEHVRVHYPDLARGWFVHLAPVELSRGVLVIRARNHPQLRYLNDHCRLAFAEAAQAATGRLVTAKFETDAPDEAELEPLSFERKDSMLPLSREYVFDNFIIGPCNRLAHAAATAAAERPGTAYNPLFVHGDVGLGKTHLLQAICHKVQKTDPDINLMYISCETFTNHFLEAVERGAIHQFRYRYRHVDVLVIDDIQFLAERERSQEEFFHTFNTLHQAERQIVLSADCSPEEIPSLEDRLVSRFNSGLVALVDRPCLETRMAIVRAKAKLRCIEISEEVVELIASRIDSNVRELAGALAKIDLMSQTHGGRMDATLAMEALGVPRPEPTIGVPAILNLFAKRYNLKLSDLQGKKRTRSIAFPRQMCMYLAREMTDCSLEEIGGYFGGRDHTTVIHAHRLIRSRRNDDPGLDQTLDDLAQNVRHDAAR
jgi:chromosomal replication initiator protein